MLKDWFYVMLCMYLNFFSKRVAYFANCSDYQ